MSLESESGVLGRPLQSDERFRRMRPTQFVGTREYTDTPDVTVRRHYIMHEDEQLTCGVAATIRGEEYDLGSEAWQLDGTTIQGEHIEAEEFAESHFESTSGKQDWQDVRSLCEETGIKL